MRSYRDRLRTSVNLLSLSADKQLAYLAELGERSEINLGLDELALDFGDLMLVLEQRRHDSQISAHAVNLLKQLDQLLDDMSGRKNAELWYPNALFASKRWEQARKLAQQASEALSVQ